MINQHVLRASSITQSFHPSVRPSVSPYMSHDQYTQRHSPDASLPGRACFSLTQFSFSVLRVRNFLSSSCFSREYESSSGPGKHHSPCHSVSKTKYGILLLCTLRPVKHPKLRLWLSPILTQLRLGKKIIHPKFWASEIAGTFVRVRLKFVLN